MAGVREAALFGDLLHAALDAASRRDGLALEIAACGFAPVEIRPIAPSLEDAFIHTIRRAVEQGAGSGA
jgi:hypothetical protein